MSQIYCRNNHHHCHSNTTPLYVTDILQKYPSPLSQQHYTTLCRWYTAEITITTVTATLHHSMSLIYCRNIHHHCHSNTTQLYVADILQSWPSPLSQQHYTTLCRWYTAEMTITTVTATLHNSMSLIYCINIHHHWPSNTTQLYVADILHKYPSPLTQQHYTTLCRWYTAEITITTVTATLHNSMSLIYSRNIHHHCHSNTTQLYVADILQK